MPIREFQVKSVTSQLHPIQKATGAWNSGAYSDYSALALAFAHKLYQELNVPIGILNCSWSQTSIQSWIPREGWATAEDDYSKKFHLLCQQTDPSTPEHKQAWDAFFQSLENQIAAGEAAIKAGKMAKHISEPVPGNLSSNRDATWMFNGRLNPVIPYAVRGAIWNQGYANAAEGLPYYHNLHNLVRGWRIVWDRPDLPVYFHQFYSAGMNKTGEEDNSPTIGAATDMRHGTFLAREDRVWHPASMKIDGEKVIVSSPAVPNPRGISYGTAGIGWQANLYNKALLPMTPFIHYDQKMVTAKSWPEQKLQVVGKTIDPGTIGKLDEYRKMPLLSTQFRDDAIFQADQPVTIWGSTRQHGEWRSFWNDHIPTMIQTRAVPADTPWGGNWASYPSPDPKIGKSTATFNHNVYVASFGPTSVSGIVFLPGKATVADDQRANFGPEMAALAKSCKGCFTLGKEPTDIPFFHTMPSSSLAPKITRPQDIPGTSTTIEINDWLDLNGILEAIVK